MTWMKGCCSVFSTLPRLPSSDSFQRAPVLSFVQIRSKKLSSVAGRKTRSERRRRGGEKSEFFIEKNRFVKILLHWNFTAREALTTVSLCVKADPGPGHRQTYPDPKSISHTLTSLRPAGDGFKLEVNGFLKLQYIIQWHVGCNNIVICKHLGFVKCRPSNNRAHTHTQKEQEERWGI